MSDEREFMTPREVAVVFRVDPKTVTRWANAGKIGFIRTLGGHRRYATSEVQALLHAYSPAQDANVLAILAAHQEHQAE